MFVPEFEFHSGRKWVHQVRRARISTATGFVGETAEFHRDVTAGAEEVQE